MGKTIAIASGKGGTGKTMFAANLGGILAKQNYSVVLLDLDMGLRNLDLYMGLENRVVYDIGDVVNGICKIKQALIKDKSFPQLYFMAAAPYKAGTEITPAHIRALCNKLKAEFDFVIIDSAAGIDESFLLAAKSADSAIVVLTPEYSSLRDCEIVTDALDGAGVKQVGYVLNKVNVKLMQKGMAPGPDQLSHNIRSRLVGLIEYDENIHISTNLGVPAVYIEDSPITHNFITISKRILSMK